MSAKMKRRRRHDRRKRILSERREWAEDAAFFATGKLPASATSCAVCSCGAAAFSRTRHDGFLEEFWDRHGYCVDDEEQSRLSETHPA